MCVGVVGASTIFCMLKELECKTDLNGNISGQHQRNSPPVNRKGAWFVMEPTSARYPIYAYFHTLLTQDVVDQVEGFTGLQRSEFTFEIWAGVFQVLK